MGEDTRRLTALMITDMVGYTRLSQRNEALALRLLDEHNGIIRDSVASHGGREVKQTGDGFFVEFPSALQAVSCSIDIQRRLYERNQSISEGERFDVRIGLHIGDVVYRSGDMFGDGVNIASRIEPLALPGGVSLSQSVHAQVWNKIDRPLKSLGPKELKNVDLPMEVFRVVLPWEKKEDDKRKPQKLDRNRLAVLPLVNISQNPEDAYFADGMTEELIYTLSRILGLRVIAQTSVMAYKGTTKTVREIGHELKVGSILEGSVRKAGDRVRITVQLIDVRSEEHVWSERYDRELADVFEIQSEISIEVAKGLKAFIKAAGVSGAVEKPTERLDAYTEYLKGRHFWNRRTRTAVLQALDHFELAIVADPRFAKAYSGLADCYTVLANQGHEPAHAVLPKAKDAAKKALELDPDLAEAHASLGIVYLQFKQDAAAAEKEFAKAIELNPSYAPAQQWYA
jgi:adenylate cyclase